MKGNQQNGALKHVERLRRVIHMCLDMSVYFREPGGVLFEIAADPPGFTIDEPLEALGQHLKLPKMYESRRSEIENVLPQLY